MKFLKLIVCIVHIELRTGERSIGYKVVKSPIYNEWNNILAKIFKAETWRIVK